MSGFDMRYFKAGAMMAIFLLFTGTIAASLIPPQPDPDSANSVDSLADEYYVEIIPSDSLRPSAVHNAGRIYLPISCGDVPPHYYYDDPETGQVGRGCFFPHGSGHKYIATGALWIGGIVGGDTIVSVSEDGYYGGINEFWPSDPTSGGIRRSGDFADDEFIAVYTDTITDEDYVPRLNPFDIADHIPLGIKVTQRSYGWADSLYDDFVIITYTVENIRENYIHDGWVGIIINPSVGDTIAQSIANDDACGSLDMRLYDGDFESQSVIPYFFDNDGDPSGKFWTEASTTGAISLRFLETSFENPIYNFNWWYSSPYSTSDFGPRALNENGDPIRLFADSNLGTPWGEEDKYYIMSHSEIDYNQLEVVVHDSSDGWLGFEGFYAYCNTRILYSVGPFDLPPGDSVSFALAIVASDNFHTRPKDFDNYYDTLNPFPFQDRLGFAEMLVNHRRADSVYQSGFQLPRPGPPAGLYFLEYDDSFAILSWKGSLHADVIGYNVYFRDVELDSSLIKFSPIPVSDTSITIPLEFPDHYYHFAVSSVCEGGYESALSFAKTLFPAQAHTPIDFAAVLDSMTPALRWQPYSDTSILVYMIYRSQWDDPLSLYDSTASLNFSDLGADVGVKYNYAVAAKNDNGMESPLSETISLLAMPLDKGILFYDMNYYFGPDADPFRREYLNVLIGSLRRVSPVAYHSIEENRLSLDRLAHYELVIFDLEKSSWPLPEESFDSLQIYFNEGGKGLFILPNSSANSLHQMKPVTHVFEADNLFYDLLHLDSSVSNAIVFEAGSLHGDLAGCNPVVSRYPTLVADMSKLENSPIPVSGAIPLSGYIFPREGVEQIYSYNSIYSDSIFQGQSNGIFYSDSLYSLVLFNFPLSLMQNDAALQALYQAMSDLGMDIDCGDLSENGKVDIGDARFYINYLYFNGPPPETGRADLNCDGEVDMEDLLILINLIFHDGASLECCP